MRLWSVKRLSFQVALVAAALGLTHSRVSGQVPAYGSPPKETCAPGGSISPTMPGYPSMPGTTTPGTTTPGTTTPGTTTPDTTGQGNTNNTGDTGSQSSSGGDSFGGGLAGAGLSGSTSVAYLDSAIPKSMFRLRYDAGFGMNRPDRAEYFYAAWKELSFHPHGINGGGGVFFDPNAKGPAQLPGSVNFQEPSAYLEWAFNCRMSVFADVPLRYVNFRSLQEDNPESENKRNQRNAPAPGSPFFPEPDRGNETNNSNNNPFGLSDVQAGFKYALLADCDQYFTFQLRTYFPSGDPRTGLGTGHLSFEPGLLYYRRLTDELVVQAEIKDWIPVAGGPLQGNILNYGVGVSYDVYHCGNLRVTPVAECVGWTVLNGYESFFGPVAAAAPPGVELPLTHGVADASGDTIINAKVGVRVYFGEGHDVYIGWGHALTQDRWYQDLYRVEYRYSF